MALSTFEDEFGDKMDDDVLIRATIEVTHQHEDAVQRAGAMPTGTPTQQVAALLERVQSLSEHSQMREIQERKAHFKKRAENNGPPCLSSLYLLLFFLNLFFARSFFYFKYFILIFYPIKYMYFTILYCTYLCRILDSFM